MTNLFTDEGLKELHSYYEIINDLVCRTRDLEYQMATMIQNQKREEEQEKKARTLKPCPFCGETNLIMIQVAVFWIECLSCKCCGPDGANQLKACILWNGAPRRAAAGGA